MAHPTALLQLRSGASLQPPERRGVTSASLAPRRLQLSPTGPRRASSAGAVRGLRAARAPAPLVPQAFHNGEHLEMRGSNKWKGLLPRHGSNAGNCAIDPDLRATILMYGELAEVTYDSFIGDPSSRNFGKNRYSPQELLKNTLLPTSLAMARGYELLPDEEKAYMYATEGAYKLSNNSKEGNPSPDRIADPQNKNWIGYIAISTKPAAEGTLDIAIAFRGTITAGEWATNFLGDRLVEWDPADQKPGVKVHDGFRATYWLSTPDGKTNKVDPPRETVRKALDALLRIYGTKIGSVTVTGHSLGGALATLAAYDVALRLHPGDKAKGIAKGDIRAQLDKDKIKISDKIHVSAITFASPRVGNPNFKAALEAASVPVLRVVNYRDVVPLMPGILGTAVTKTLYLAGIDARAPGDGVGGLLKFLNYLAQWTWFGNWAYEHTDPEWLVYNDDITYDEMNMKDNSHRPMRVLDPKDIRNIGPRHNLEVYLYMVATLCAAKGGAIARDAILMNKGDWCLESKWLLERGLPDVPARWYQPLVCKFFHEWKVATYGSDCSCD